MELVGRDTERKRIAGLVDDVASGWGRALYLTGEEGIGKTRLADEAASIASARGFTVLRAGADELDRGRPFGLLAAALGDDAVVPRDVPEGVNAHHAIGDAICDRLAEIAESAPVALICEDLQWADPSTVAALRRATTLPVLVLGTLRPSPRPVELWVLLDEADVVDLGPLGPADAAALARSAGAPVGAAIDAAGGNPLYVLELVRALADGADPDELPRTLHATVLRRLRSLEPRTVDDLRVASVFGATFALAELARVLGRPARLLLPGTNEAIACGVLEDGGDRLAFRHRVLRDAIYEGLAAPVRRGLHLEVARVLAATGAPVVDVARHYATGASPGDREAVACLREAAAVTAAKAPAVAVELLDRALELLPDDDPERETVLAEAVLPRLWSGDAPGAEDAARRALARLGERPLLRATVRTRLAVALDAQGRAADAITELEAAARSLDGRAAARARAEASRIRLAAGYVDAARADAAAALAEGERLGDDHARCVATMTLASIALRSDAPAVELAERAVAIADASDDRTVHVLPVRELLAEALIASGRFDDAGRELGGRTTSLAAVLRFHTGAWDDAVAEAQAAPDVRSWTVLARIALHRGEPVPSLGDPEPGGFAAALALEAAGDRDAALDALAGVPGRDARTHAVRLALELGRTPDAPAGEGALERALRDESAGDRESLERAASAYEGLGAVRDLARVEASLRALGVRRGVRGTRKRPTTGWDAVTPTERQVLDLLKTGLSNAEIGERLFISRRTVATHLAHVYQKVGISSRAALIAALASRDV